MAWPSAEMRVGRSALFRPLDVLIDQEEGHMHALLNQHVEQITASSPDSVHRHR